MLFNSIKLNYNIKIIDDLFKTKNYKDIGQLIINNRKNKILFYDLVKYIRDRYFHSPEHSRMLKKKFIWLISYDSSDLKFINNFIQYYFNKQNLSFIGDSYTNCYSRTMEKIDSEKVNTKPSFEQIVQESDLYHLLIHYMNDEDYFVLTSNSAFFESPNNKFFIYPNSTVTFLSIVRSPYDLYSKYKSINNSQQEALEKLNYFDISKAEDLRSEQTSKYSIIENRQSWSINTKSWNDENVKDAYRGKVIMYSDLVNSPEEVLTDLVYHLKQCGLPLEIDYKLINDFTSQNTIEEDQFDFEMSKQETKLIYNGLDKNLLDDLNFHRDN